jgi:hydrogenase expression/formation protein HypE
MNSKAITIDHGSGGRLSHDLINSHFLAPLDNPYLAQLNDSAVIKFEGSKLAFSTDSFVIDPIFFKGGNIGSLAVHGTVNDLAMSGAKPLYLAAGFIIEEGFLLDDLDKIIVSMKNAADEAGVLVVTGDTKVVPRGCADKIFINISGVGAIADDLDIAGQNAKAGDSIIVSGTIGDHGIAIMAERHGLTLTNNVVSDSAPLNNLVSSIIASNPGDIHVLRDPTRGGLGTTLNEIAGQAGVGIRIFEEKIPIKKEVSAACELLGFDPLYLANEGKLIAFVAAHQAEQVVTIMKENKYGSGAAIIGEVLSDDKHKVLLTTRIGGSRIINMPRGEPLPRIC